MNGIGGYMRPKPCSHCGDPADFSFVILASTLQLRPRQQQSSASVPFCRFCIEAAISSCTSEPLRSHHSPLTDALTAALHALTQSSSQQFNSKPDNGGNNAEFQTIARPTSDAKSEASCRPCLIACNSRQFDEVADTTTGLKGVSRE